MAKEKMITGVAPSGDLTIGNYLAVVKKLVEYQDEYDLKVFIANLHAITMPQDQAKLHEKIQKLAALYFACGLDHTKASVFLQSDVPEHAELGWILTTQATVGELERMTQYKDKSQKSKAGNGTNYIPAGLLTYPALMAADILMYDVTKVPVGQDQFQHLELTRNLAERFNNKFGQTFIVPQSFNEDKILKIMDLQDPTKKMSKSGDNEKGIVKVLDEPEMIRKKVASAITDSENLIKFDPVNKPGVSNLLTILKVLTNKSFEQLEQEFQGKNYKDLKDSVSDSLINELEPIQAKFKELYKSPQVEEWLKEAAKKNQLEASAKLKDVKTKMGLNY